MIHQWLLDINNTTISQVGQLKIGDIQVWETDWH